MLRTVFKKTVALQAGLAALLSIALARGFAQQPPVVERPSPRPLEEPTLLPGKPAKVFELPPVVESPAAPGQAGPTVEVKDITFEGNHAIPTAELQHIAKPFAGRAVTRAELEQLREAISRFYLERGYINSGAILPDDFYGDGIVRLQIIEGRIEEIRLSGMRRLRDRYIRDRLIQGDEPLNVNILQERFQLLLADPLFSKINARLMPGSQLGLARIDLDVTRARPWDLNLFANNYRSPSVGSEAIGLNGHARNVTGLGDTLNGTVQGGHHDNERYSFGWSIPITGRTRAHLRYDRGSSTVLEEPLASLDVESTLDSREVGAAHTLVETLRRHFSVGMTYVQRENATKLLGEPFSFVAGEGTGTSKISAWRVDQDFVQRWTRQALALRSTLTWGRTNTESTPVTADIVPPKHYLFWLGQLQFTHRVLDKGSDFVVRTSMQFSRDRLVPLERFAIGGVATVRGYRENQVVRDQGYTATFEFRYPLWERTASRHQLTVVPFLDYGEAWNKHEPREQLASAGVGLEYRFYGFAAELYYGKRLREPEVKTSGDLQDKGIHVQLRHEL